MRFDALQEDFDEWLSSMQLSSHCSEIQKILPLFKVESSAYSIPTIKLWDDSVQDDSSDVFNAIMDLPLLPYDRENIKNRFIRSLPQYTVQMPKFCTDVLLGHVYLEPVTPIECDRIFEFFQPPPIEEALHIDKTAKAGPPLYLKRLNMLFAVFPDIKFEVEPEGESGWKLDSCEEEELPPAGLIESLVLDHYTSKDRNSYLSSIDVVLEVDQIWSIAKDIQLPCDQIMCDENLEDLGTLDLEEHLFIEPPSRDLFHGLPTLVIDDVSFDFSSFEEKMVFEEATIPAEDFPCSGPPLCEELTFKVSHGTTQVKCETEKENDVRLEDCTVIVNYGTLKEYKVMSELSKRMVCVIERDFGPPESRLLLLSSEHAIILSDPDTLTDIIARTILERFAYVWIALMIGENHYLSKTMIRLANSKAAMNVKRCKLLVIKDAKDLCHLVGKIKALEKINSTAEEALSAVLSIYYGVDLTFGSTKDFFVGWIGR